jgi:hypothetical protein
MKDRLKLLSPALVVVTVLATASCLLIYEREFLWKVQEMNLFLDTPLFLKQQMVASGWLLTWLGCYFTEFFYQPLLGVTLLTLWWVVLLLVIWSTFRIPVKWTAVLLIPLAAIIIMNVDLGYWVYYLKLKGHFFAATIGTTLAVGSVWIFRLLPTKYFLRPIYMVVSTGVLYPLIGFYGLLSTLLMGIIVWRLEKMTLTDRVVASVVAVLSVIFWPLFYYNYVFCQTSLENIWWTGLPLFIVDKELPNYYIPYYILGASLVFMALMYEKWTKLEIRKPILWLGIQIALVAVAGYSVHRFWYKDYNFHKELRMQQCMENLDWQGIVEEAVTGNEEPTRAIVMMKDLALFRLGRQGNEMYRYKDGSKACDTPVPVRMMQVVGYSLYYNYGLINYCHRWCMEQGVEFGFCVEYQKYLMRCALMNQEQQEARKYASLLKHTRYHKAWAEKYERFIGHTDKMKTEKEFSQICSLMTTSDILSSDQMLPEKFIMEYFIKNDSDDKLFKEQALISALWSKDIQTFWPRFFDYANSHPGEHMPIHYQEAAYLYGNLEHQVDISKMPFDDQVKQDFKAFMQLANSARNSNEEEMIPIFYSQFGHTFYYNYFLVRNLKFY